MTVELISIHVPKTAGVSFRQLLGRVYGEERVAFDYDDRVLDPAAPFRADPDGWRREVRDPFIARLGAGGARAVHGHFALGKYRGQFPEARRIVWLREPVARLVSHYCYWRGLPPAANTLHRRVVEEDLSLEEFAALEPMRDVVTRTFLAGAGPGELDFIGRQENFDADLQRLGRLLGWPSNVLPARAPVENRTGRSETMLRSLGAAAVARLEALNPGDVALFRRAWADATRHETAS